MANVANDQQHEADLRDMGESSFKDGCIYTIIVFGGGGGMGLLILYGLYKLVMLIFG